jgi:hypothetical protein
MLHYDKLFVDNIVKNHTVNGRASGLPIVKSDIKRKLQCGSDILKKKAQFVYVNINLTAFLICPVMRIMVQYKFYDDWVHEDITSEAQK